MTKILPIFVLALLLPGILSGGCGGSNATVTFDQLIGQAAKYNGKTVTLEAFYFDGFEIAALAGSLSTTDSGVFRVVPTSPLIWVSGGVTSEVHDRLYTQTDTPSGYPEHFGKLKITGSFETDSKYGHLNAYSYQIKVEKAEIVDWAPPTTMTPSSSATAGTLQFKVIDAGGVPLSGAKVVSDIQPVNQMKLTGITDKDGSVVFINVVPGSYSFYINRFDYELSAADFTVSHGQTKTLTIVLKPAATP